MTSVAGCFTKSAEKLRANSTALFINAGDCPIFAARNWTKLAFLRLNFAFFCVGLR
ncbi:hypothetical protein AC062_1482 [Pasteurellaceae bacterium NI1060]|nr:hypothetical protein AC062_1482 [Pasteurellaceae bacterium NI1060]